MNNLEALYEKVLAFLERLILIFTTWYGATYYERAKTSVKTAEKLTEAIAENNAIRDKVKGMTRDEKIKIAVSDD